MRISLIFNKLVATETLFQIPLCATCTQISQKSLEHASILPNNSMNEKVICPVPKQVLIVGRYQSWECSFAKRYVENEKILIFAITLR